MNSSEEKPASDFSENTPTITKGNDGLVTVAFKGSFDLQNAISSLHKNSEKSCTSENCLLRSSLNGTIKLNLLISLSLSDCNLSELPNCVSQLRVKELNLSHNRLKEVPECVISGLRLLEVLDLSYNKISDFQKKPICVQKLRFLNLESNVFVNIPEWILQVQCFNLEKFYYSFNRIMNLKNSAFQKVSYYRLEKLEMKNCGLINEDREFLKNIRTLRCLDISNNRQCSNFNNFSNYDILFKEVEWRDCITVLNLSSIDLSVFPNELCEFISLVELDVSNNCLIWLPNSIYKLKNLRTLDISKNNLSGFPQTFGQLLSLETLKAAYNSISELPYGFSSLSKLKYLDLYTNELDILSVTLSHVDCIDLERNFFDTENQKSFPITDYEVKKSALRAKLDECRLNGPQEQEETSSERTTSTISVTDSYEWECDFEDEVVFSNSNIMEFWDDVKEALPKNDCTDSDNEWQGYEDIDKPNSDFQKKTVCSVIRWPSYLFEDAEE